MVWREYCYTDGKDIVYIRKYGKNIHTYDFISCLSGWVMNEEEFKRKYRPIGFCELKQIHLDEGCRVSKPFIVIVTSDKYGIIYQNVHWWCSTSSCALRYCKNESVTYPKINRLKEIFEMLKDVKDFEIK